MKKITYQALLLLSIILLLLASGCAPKTTVRGDAPAADEPAVITDIRIQDNSITIVGNKHFIYTMYKGSDPYKMTVDIPDIGAGIFREKIISDKAGITEVMPQQSDSPVKSVKITITLQNPSTITPLYRDNSLTLMVKAEEPLSSGEMKEAAVPEEPAPAKEASVPASAPSKTPEYERLPAERSGDSPIAYIPKATEVSSIDVNRAADMVKVVIAGNGSMMPNVFPIDERIVIDIPGVVLNAQIPKNILSPLKGIRAGKHKEKVRLVLDLREKTKFEVAAVGKTIEVSLMGRSMQSQASAAAVTKETPVGASKELPRTAMAKPGPMDPVVDPAKENNGKDMPAGNGGPVGKYTGKKISLDFQDAEIGPIFRLLADVNGYNLVLDPSVKGKVTIKLMNVPWDQALDIILNTFNLGKSIDGNILWIAPQTIFAKIIEEKSAAKVTEEKAEELVQEVLRINYASSADLQTAFTTGKLLSPRGSITEDKRMNTLIIKDTQRSIDKMKELVKIMDVTKPQVMIEAKIVEVGNNYNETLGIRWGGAMQLQSGPYPVGGSFSVNTPVVTTGSATTNPGGALGLTIGAANSLKVDLSLSALESIGKSRTLSNPKVLTLDGEAANIQQGRTFFISTVSQAGTQTQQQTATLSLQVTPKITPDGYVQLKVTATDNALESVDPPVVNTKSLNTQALVKNGETLVLGGIFVTDETKSDTGVPWLGRLPGLGWLFKTRNQSGPNVKELLIFITPTIVTQQVENK